VRASLERRRIPRVSCSTCEVDREWCDRFRRGDVHVMARPVVESSLASLYQAWFKASCRGIRKAARKRAREKMRRQRY